MKKVSVTKWNKERTEERSTIELIHEALDLADSKHMNQDELHSLSEAKLHVFSVLENWDRRTVLVRLAHFKGLQDELQGEQNG